MVLLSLGSGLITALMAHAKPSCCTFDLNWIAEERPASNGSNAEGAVTASDKTPSSQ